MVNIVRPESLTDRKLAVVVIVLLFAFAVPLVGVTGQALATSAYNNGHVTNATNYAIANDVKSVWIWNGSSGPWASAAFTATTTSLKITIPEDFNVTHMLIFTDNKSMDSQNLLESGIVYQTVDFASSATSLKLANVTAYLSTYTNSSVLTNIADKAISTSGNPNAYTIYSSTVNNLGKSVAYNIVYMFADLTGMPQYALQFTGKAANASSFMYFNQTLQNTLTFNLFESLVVAIVFIAFLSVFFLYNAIPRPIREGY